MSDLIQQLLSPYEYFTDIESSGLGDGSYPIEVGIAWAGGTYEALILPVEKWTYWNAKSQKVHGISRNTLKKKGKPVVEVANELNELFNGKVLWCDSKFDVWWFDILFDAANIEATFTVKNMLKTLPTELMERLLVEMPPPEEVKHRALEDALDLKECWEKVKKVVSKDQRIIERVTKAVQAA
jgi:DNA polymerase III epsilon subunit-like protein